MGMLSIKLGEAATLKCREGRTKQRTGQEHDINKLVARYQKTGVLPVITDKEGVFTDVCQVGDYQDCCNRVIAANDMFNSLPSNVRARFGQNPVAFMEFMSNLNTPEAVDEATRLGLVIPKPVEPVKDVKDVNDATKGDVK